MYFQDLLELSTFSALGGAPLGLDQPVELAELSQRLNALKLVIQAHSKTSSVFFKHLELLWIS